MENLQRILEQRLNRLLGKIENENQEKVSPNEEMFLEHLAQLYRQNYDKSVEYARMYNKISDNKREFKGW